MFVTQNPLYLLFIRNKSDRADIKHLFDSELDLNEDWEKYNNKPWEGLNGYKIKANINQEYIKQALHIKFIKGYGNILKYQILQCGSSGKASKYLLTILKYWKLLTQRILQDSQT